MAYTKALSECKLHYEVRKKKSFWVSCDKTGACLSFSFHHVHQANAGLHGEISSLNSERT